MASKLTHKYLEHSRSNKWVEPTKQKKISCFEKYDDSDCKYTTFSSNSGAPPTIKGHTCLAFFPSLLPTYAIDLESISAGEMQRLMLRTPTSWVDPLKDWLAGQLGFSQLLVP